MMEIKHISGAIIYSGEFDSIKNAIEKAISEIEDGN